jgi:predicted ArsR family transcriptional regulator
MNRSRGPTRRYVLEAYLNATAPLSALDVLEGADGKFTSAQILNTVSRLSRAGYLAVAGQRRNPDRRAPGRPTTLYKLSTAGHNALGDSRPAPAAFDARVLDTLSLDADEWAPICSDEDLDALILEDA